MISLKLMLFLFWIITCTKALCSICITSGSESESECHQHLLIFHMLSDITTNETSCKTVHIYLTSGNHILDKNLDFGDSVEETEIHGVSHGQPSIIECMNNAGSENRNASRVLVSNVVFLRTRNISLSLLRAALYFKNTVYTLRNVIVKNTEGFGLYALDCKQQIILNCTFSSNKGNICFHNSLGQGRNDLIQISKTKIHDGEVLSMVDNSGINICMFDVHSCNISIVNCDFQMNKGGHLIVEVYPDYFYTLVIILIDNSTFNSSNDLGVL